MMFNFANYPVWINLVIFALAGGIVCFSGARLSIYADTIADRTGWGRAFIGALLLGGAASLPEIATTTTASAIGNASLAANNLLGEIGMQMAILALIDLVMVKGALTFFAPQPVLMLGGVILVTLLGLVLAANAVGEFVSLFGIGLWSLIVFSAYLISLYMIQRYERQDYWRAVTLPHQPAAEVTEQRRQEKLHQLSLKKIFLYFAVNSFFVLIAGWILAQIGDTLGEETAMGSSFIGATLLALATSLPEAITTISAVRLGAFDLAISNIFGSNALTVSLFFIADIFYREGTIFAAMDRPSMFMAALAIVLTCVFLWGLLERDNQTIYRMGVDSTIVISIYFGGLLLLYSFNNGVPT
ncbi:hypothetical protein QUB80_12320 [Chlorogloeopsis sp. ULAP01]|uniref:sodium:calcium antiporter n=1 Tax=Chlorogloeopsis sp. ULAP01 TaxID=3056483 RepID=UPI0025AA33A6|nr:hypothetical protein [Chlorogloeopsis sp. ULAP01]MDM9381486.1 hypothetical protein [Chlorogloeopsis sp. ULAP01]